MEERVEEKKSNILPVIIISTVLGIILVGFFVLMPIYKDNRLKKSVIDSKRKNLDILTAKEEKLKELSKDEEEIENDAKKVKSALPEHEDKARLFVQLEGFASVSSVVIESVSEEEVENIVQPEGALVIPDTNELIFVLEVRGQYANIKTFLMNMHKGLRIMKINKFEIKKTDDQSNLENSNTVVATITFSTYYKGEEGVNNEAAN